MHLGGELLSYNIGGTSDNNILYINKNVDNVSFVNINKQRSITLAGRKPKL